MKLLRLKFFQETACYQKPFAYKVGETYPLAPFSTVKGMLHAVLDAKEYIPLNLSIQGQSETMLIDYQKKHIYKSKNVPQFVSTAGLDFNVEIDAKNILSSMPMYQHLLVNVEHVIHVQAEEVVLEKLYERFQTLDTVISLGRWEDLVRIDDVQYVEATEGSFEQTTFNQYVPESAVKLFRSVTNQPYYRLTRKYEVYEGRRTWDYIKAMYVPKNQGISTRANILNDGEYSIFLMEG